MAALRNIQGIFGQAYLGQGNEHDKRRTAGDSNRKATPRRQSFCSCVETFRPFFTLDWDCVIDPLERTSFKCDGPIPGQRNSSAGPIYLWRTFPGLWPILGSGNRRNTCLALKCSKIKLERKSEVGLRGTGEEGCHSCGPCHLNAWQAQIPRASICLPSFSFTQRLTSSGLWTPPWHHILMYP